MGTKLLTYYDKAREMGSIKAQMRLAILTKIPSPRAKDALDSAENIKIFEEAIKELAKEFK